MAPSNLATKLESVESPIPNNDLVQAFQNAAVETLRVQCSCEIAPQPHHVKAQETEITAEVAGVIGMTSSQFIGAVAITFPKDVYLEVMGKMFGEKFEDITEDIEDGAGELLNIIFGHAKAKLNREGNDIERAIPSVVQGETFELHNLTPVPAVVMPFQTELGIFHLEIGLTS